MKVLVSDPSLFTPPYDACFCRALAAAGAEATLVGRPLRPSGDMAAGLGLGDPASPFRFRPLFYRVAESAWLANSAVPAKAAVKKAIKAAEHRAGLKALERLAQAERFDAIHAQWLVLPRWEAGTWARLRGAAPLVLTSHNSDGLHGAQKSKLQVEGLEDALKLFDGHLVHAEKTREHLTRLGVDPARILLHRHPPIDLAGGAAKGPGPDPDGPPVIAFVGSIKPYKGLDVLLQALLELERRRPGLPFRLEAAGRPFADTAPLEALAARAADPSRFSLEWKFLEEAEIAKRLDRASLAVFPYRSVDGSGALSLAAARGVPAVASAVGSFKEAPIKDHARLVPPGDVGALSAALEELLGEPAKLAELRARSAGLARALGTWSGLAEACLSFYRELGRSRAAAPRLTA